MARKSPTESAKYEILYIIPNKFSEDELKPVEEKVKALIESNKGEIKNSHFWGKKKLAYPIKQSVFGYYTLLDCVLSSDSTKEIDRSLRIMPEILRHMIVKVDPKVRSSAPKRVAPAKKVEEAPVLAKKIDASAAESAKKKDSEKVDLKDLDESLDKLLDVDNLL